MAWRKVTEADLNAALSQSEIDGYRRSAVEGDPVESQIRQACNFVRGCIRSGGAKVRMSREEDCLPESLIGPAMDYMRYQILTRLDTPVNDNRTKAYDHAVGLFDQLRRGEFTPESDTVDPEPLADDPAEKATTPIAAAADPPHLLD